jgi:hypothetical protein
MTDRGGLKGTRPTLTGVPPLQSLGKQEIEKESFLRRRRRSRGSGSRARRAGAILSRRRRETIGFLAQRRSRRRRLRRGEPSARRRVEPALAPARRKAERRHHGGRQGQPAPSVDGFFHLHPTTPIVPKLHAIVMPALVAGIHAFLAAISEQGVDGRDKPSHDSGSAATRPEFHCSKSRAPYQIGGPTRALPALTHKSL